MFSAPWAPSFFQKGGSDDFLCMLNSFCRMNRFLLCWIIPAESSLFYCMLNFFCWKEGIFFKMCFFLLKCWICWIMFYAKLWKSPSFCWNVEYVEYVECFVAHEAPFADHGVQWAKKTFNIFNIFNISAERSIFSEPYIQHDSTYSTFSRKKQIKKKKSLFRGKNPTWPQKVVLSAEKIQHGPKSGSFSRKNSTCAENVLLSAEMLNMLNALGLWSEICAKLEEPNGPKNIQHIQHIQHFSRKKHFFGTLDPTWFSIFNISAERSISSKKRAVSGKKSNMAPKVVLSAEKIQHGPKSGSFSRKNSTWPKKWFFQQKEFNMCRKCASFCWNVEYVECIGPVVGHFSWIGGALWAKKHSTCSTYSAFQQKEAFFWNLRSNMIQHIQHFSWKKPIAFAECTKPAFREVFGHFSQKSHETPIFIVFLFTWTQK